MSDRRLRRTSRPHRAPTPSLVVALLAVLSIASCGDAPPAPTGQAFFPIATIRGRIVTADGLAPGENGYDIATRSVDPGACGGDLDGVGHGVRPDGAFEMPCNPGRWTIVVRDLPPGAEDWVEIGHGDVVVPPGGVVELRITLDPPAP